MKREAFFFLCLNIGFAEANPNRALKISETESPSRGEQANREDGAASGWGHSRTCPELVEGLPLKISPYFFCKESTESKIFFLLLALFFTKNPGFLRGYSFGTQKVVGRLTEYDFSGNSFLVSA